MDAKIGKRMRVYNRKRSIETKDGKYDLVGNQSSYTILLVQPNALIKCCVVD
jgi:hypothetical protein